MRRGWRCAIAFAAALSLAARFATADELRIGATTVEVTVVADPEAGCPTEAAFREAVRAAVAAPAGSGGTDAMPPSHFEVFITADRDGATSTLTSRSDGSTSAQQRKVRGATCRQVAEAIALVLVLSIDPLAGPIHLPLVPPTPTTGTPSTPTGPPSQPPMEPSIPPPVEKAHQAPATTTTGTSRHRSVQLGAVAKGGAMVGLLPNVAPLLEGMLVATLPTALPLELRVGAGAFLPDERRLGSGVVDFWGVRARGDVCPAWRTSASGARLTLGACGGATFDWIFTSARGFPLVTTTGVLVPSVTTGAFAGYDFGAARRWSIGLDADMGFVLVATSWTLISVGQVQHTLPVTGRLGAFVRVNFP